MLTYACTIEASFSIIHACNDSIDYGFHGTEHSNFKMAIMYRVSFECQRLFSTSFIAKWLIIDPSSHQGVFRIWDLA